ncbi:MAG: Hpt domain-containing protein [Sneathiella sp.]
MTKIVKMEGYEIHHPASDLKRKASTGEGISLKEIEKRMAKKMVALEAEFLKGVPPVIEAIESALGRLEKGKRANGDQEEIFRQGHDLKGMGGSFGYPIMGTIGSGICELSRKEIETKDLMLPLIRVHLDLLIYVNANRIKDDTDPKAAPILAALANATPK